MQLKVVLRAIGIGSIESLVFPGNVFNISFIFNDVWLESLISLYA